MKIITETPIDSETLFYALTGKYTYCIEKEERLKAALRKAGITPTFFSREEAQRHETAEYVDIMLTDFIKLKKYHRYIEIPAADKKLFLKRVQEAESQK